MKVGRRLGIEGWWHRGSGNVVKTAGAKKKREHAFKWVGEWGIMGESREGI